MDLADEASTLLTALATGLEDSSEEVAGAYYTLFSDLQEAGFTEEQAMRILCESKLLDGEAQ